jgi:hypothetical protein
MFRGFSGQNDDHVEDCTTEEQHFVLHFLWAKGLDGKDVHKEMFPVYGGKCLLHKVVHIWVDKFSQGHLKVVVDDAQPGCHVQIATETTVQRVEELI